MKKYLFLIVIILFIAIPDLQGIEAQNTAVGDLALYENTTGYNNTAIGYNALTYNTIGFDNTATGSTALRNNVDGNYNSATGFNSLISNTSGGNNTANGVNSLYSNTTGFHNTANGVGSLFSNTTGNYNSASGEAALYNNITGSYNAGMGVNSLYSNTTGDANTAIGNSALYSNTTGNNNTANGTGALYFNTTGNENTATGHDALHSNTTALYNVANGFNALYSNTTGYQNSATGANSLNHNKTGHDNASNGYFSLYKNTTGSGNVAMGNYTLRNNTNGSNNTVVGDSAASVYTYSNSTFVGYKTTSTVSGLTNITVIGNGTSATASNQVRIGNTKVTSIGGQVGWSTLSDGRYKKNIKEDVPGLAFINTLRAVTYSIDVQGLDNALKNNEPKTNNDGNEQPTAEEIKANAENAKIRHTGFVAQEVEKAAKKLNYDFSGVDAPKNETDLYGLRYSEFVVPLVKAVQELSAQNNELKQEVEDLKATVQLLVKSNLQTTSNTIILSGASLEQNTPNPFNQSTIIRYTLPVKFVSAQIIITDEAGKVLKQNNISIVGKGILNIQAGSLAAGTYNYSLIVDGHLVDTKKMVLVK